jgi:hypothetical protein
MAGPVISLAQLIMPRSAQQVINDFFGYLANPPDPSLVSVRTANWRTGGPYRFLAYRQGIEASLLYQIIASFAGSAFLRYATGRWLDWLGQDFFDEPRQGAQFSTVTLSVTIPAGAGPYGPLQLQAQTTDGKTFVSTTLVTLPAGPFTTLVQVKATSAGSAYNVGANTITQLVTPNVLGISVTNAAAATGGFDEEIDSRYQRRLAAKWGVLATGSPASAYVYWAMTASIEVQKVRVYSDNLNGVFADKYTTVVVSGTDVPVSAGALAAVDQYIQPRIPLDSLLSTVNAIVLPLTVTGAVRVFQPYVVNAHVGIANALVALNARVPIGSYDVGPITVEAFTDAVNYDPTQVYDVALVSPAAPVAPTYNQLLVATDGTTVMGV